MKKNRIQDVGNCLIHGKSKKNIALHAVSNSAKESYVSLLEQKENILNMFKSMNYCGKKNPTIYVLSSSNTKNVLL